MSLETMVKDRTAWKRHRKLFVQYVDNLRFFGLISSFVMMIVENELLDQGHDTSFPMICFNMMGIL